MIERLARAAEDPSSWDEMMSPSAVQENAQPEPLASKWDPISEYGVTEPCECKSQMVTAHTTIMYAHLPHPVANAQPLPQPPIS